MEHATSHSLKTIGYSAVMLVALLIGNFVALAFITGFGAGLASSTAPTVYVLGFVGAAVWLAPFNYVALRKIFD